jgi:multidrug efflux pump subunit AcrB
LLALALAVGLVIDDAIVVIENIVRYIEEKGMKPFPAAIAATKDIGLAVLATTLALMTVFVPVSFMSGMVGRFLRSFGLTMASAIAVSLFVSFTLTPMLGARWLKSRDGNAPPDRLTRIVNAFYRPIERGYTAALRFVMNHRWWVILGCFALMLSTGSIAKHLTGSMMPSNDKGQFQISLRAPEGTSVAETRLIAERLVTDVRTLPGVIHTLITVGDDSEKTSNLASVRVVLSDPKTRAVTQDELMQRTRKEYVSKLPKTLRTTVAEVSDIGVGSSSNITYAVTGPDATTLERVATEITERLRQVPGATDVDNSLIVGKPEAKVTIDRDRAADLGVQVSDIATTLNLFVGGLKASTYPDGGEQYDIRVRGEERFRADTAALSVLTVPSSKYGAVPLDSVTTLTHTTGPSKVTRVARSRQVTITANSAPGVGDTFVENKLLDIGREVLPSGYQLVAQGRSKEASKLVGMFVLAISLSVLFMYLVLAAQFESWLDPLSVMLVLPLTVPFAFLSLWGLGQSINLFSLLGLLVLIGVVQKNAVLQVDHTKQLRAEGKSRLEAILQANRDRLRPILMTTLAFVAGMLPLVVSKGVGAGYNRAMSGIVVGGQTLSLLVTLLACPVIYSLLDDLANFIRRKLPRGRTREETGETELDQLEA